MNGVTVQVPATTANLGPGYDCLSMALDIWNSLRFEVGERPGMHVTGEGEGQLSSGTDNLVYQAAERYFREAGRAMPTLSISCHNEIPLARGLGSSSAAIVGGLLGASAVAEESPPDLERLLDLAVAMEGHPDNVAAALFGGCQIVARDKGTLVRETVPVRGEFQAVLFIPDMPMPTAEAREVLPTEVSREDAVYNMSRVALLVNALVTGNLANLGIATQDRLHQPARQRLLPAMPLVLRSALAAGALGVFLSGAGSTILALTQGKELTVAYEMAEVANKAGLPGDVKVTRLSTLGSHISELG